jgi:5-methylcytosine-specific restriction enzyme A
VKSISSTLIICFSLSLFASDRSPLWRQVRNDFVKTHNHCEICGSFKDLEVHHIRPFHLAPELELDPSNLITLCKSKKWGIDCHLIFGHAGNYYWENKSIKEDVEVVKELYQKDGGRFNKMFESDLLTFAHYVHEREKINNKRRTK